LIFVEFLLMLMRAIGNSERTPTARTPEGDGPGNEGKGIGRNGHGWIGHGEEASHGLDWSELDLDVFERFVVALANGVALVSLI
jgi:hypothetical protein